MLASGMRALVAALLLVSAPAGALVQDDVNRVIRAHAGSFKACYVKELAKSPGLAGKVVVQFTVGVDGKVSNAKVADSTLRSEPVERCLVRAFAALEFPRRSSATTVKFPLVMTSR